MQDQSPAIQDFLNGTPAGTLLSHKCIYRPGVLRTVIIMMLEAYYVYVYNTCALNIYPGDTNSHPAQELMHFCFRDVGSMNTCKPDEPGFHLHIAIVSTYKCSCVPCTIWIINLRARAQKKSRIACNTGVIHVTEIFTELPCSSSSCSSSSSSSASSSSG